MADEVWAWCEKAQAFGRTVTVKIKYADFRQATRSRTLPAIVTSQEALRDVSLGLVRTVLPPAKGIRLVGVTLSHFERADRPPPGNSTWVSECMPRVRINRSTSISGGRLADSEFHCANIRRHFPDRNRGRAYCEPLPMVPTP